LEGGNKLVATKHGHTNDQDDQNHRQNDEVIADLEDRLLEVADGVRRFNELCGLAEVSRLAGGRNHGVDLPPLENRAGIDRFTGLAGDGQ
jgi:hypothetical protein